MRLLTFTIAVLAISLSPAGVIAAPLSSSEILTRITDQTFLYRGVENGRKKEGSIVYGKNGRLYILTKQNYVDGGTWNIVANQMCTRVTLGRGGKRVCFYIYPKKYGAYSTSHKYELFPVVDDRFKGV